jgi:predicted  nucleic acid-binding Zn-ribbon protein
MPSVTSALRECHRLRVHLRNLQAEIDQGPRLQKGREEELEAARQAHQAHFDHITKLKLKQREDEGTLKQTEVRLAKLELQLNDVAGQKEYAAKQSEIEQAKAKKGELEDAILATIMELEERTAALPAVEKAWADAQAEFARAQAEAAERLEGMLADQQACRADLARHEATLPPEVKATYDSVVRAKGPDALSGARNRVCQACRTAMTEGRFGELKGGALLVCNSCGRLLYPVE